MHPDLLADLLAAKPYPGCNVSRADDALRLDFDGLILVYRADGWHHDGRHLECLLSDYSAPEQVHAEIRRVLTFVFSLGVDQALSEAVSARGEDPVEYLTDLAARKMLAILDVAALANGRQAKIDDLRAERDDAQAQIASNVAAAAARDMRIADLERDLAAKDESVKTAHAALAQVSDLLGSPPPVVPDDAVEAVKMHLARRPQPAPVESDLDAAGAPKVYHFEDGSTRAIPTAERIRLLGERVHNLRAKLRKVVDDANCLKAIVEGHNALDTLHAPRLADGLVLSLAARIRALKT